LSFSKSSIVDISTHCAGRDKLLLIRSIQYVANKYEITPRQISERLQAKEKDRSDLVEILNAAYEIAICNSLKSLDLSVDISVCIDDSGSMDINAFVPPDLLGTTDVLLKEIVLMYPDASVSIMEPYPEDEDEEEITS